MNYHVAFVFLTCFCFSQVTQGKELKLLNDYGEQIWLHTLVEDEEFWNRPLYMRRNGPGLLDISKSGRYLFMIEDGNKRKRYAGWVDVHALFSEYPNATLGVRMIYETKAQILEQWYRCGRRWCKRRVQVNSQEKEPILSLLIDGKWHNLDRFVQP